MLAGLGNGIGDAAWNSWVGSLADSSHVISLMHACYGVGAVLGPMTATVMISKAQLLWHTFYYFMVSVKFPPRTS